MNKIMIISMSIALTTIIVPIHNVEFFYSNNINENIIFECSKEIVNDEIEYWALLIAGGIYANNPAKRLDPPPIVCNMLHKTLLISERWDENHIKSITWKNATHIEIIKGFQWLDQMEDENDICLIYFNTHGGSFPFDFPPLDEEDGKDEIIPTYNSWFPIRNPFTQLPFTNPFGFMTDDEINYFINRLESHGICMIFDSCHSGGFNDNWSFAYNEQRFDFASELGKDFEGKNRVIITSCSEEELTYGANWFSYYLRKGMQGYADSNSDGLCSAEEVFNYTKPFILDMDGVYPDTMYPQIFDDYPGELLLTEVEMPPLSPIVKGENIVKTNITYHYQIYSEDAEGDKIKYFIDWGDGSNDSTDFHDSGKTVNISHNWSNSGTYTIKLEATDEKGVTIDDGLIITVTDTYLADQRQVKVDHGVIRLNIPYFWLHYIDNTYWLAQSFIPSFNTLAKVELGFQSSGIDEAIVSIRAELNGSDLAFSSLIPPSHDWNGWFYEWHAPDWVMFDFPDIELILGKEYYIVARQSTGIWGDFLSWTDDNPYINGSIYFSEDAGETWKIFNERPNVEFNTDVNFVTYGV
ncbi:PKD domain-containing protein [Thermoplasmatota archaeon]